MMYKVVGIWWVGCVPDEWAPCDVEEMRGDRVGMVVCVEGSDLAVCYHGDGRRTLRPRGR
jgi:hypothetical protein